MPLPRCSTKWVVLASLISGAGIASYLLYRRKKLLRFKERERKLRLKLDQHVCFGRPGTETVVVNSVEDWKKVEGRFLSKVDSTRMIGLDCEWITEGKTAGKVALLQLALTDGFCVLVRTCKVLIGLCK